MKGWKSQKERGRFKVYVAENSHFGNSGEGYLKGDYADCSTAVEVCKQVVDDFLLKAYDQGKTEEQLLHDYTLYGDDPYVVAGNGVERCDFSSWDYARARIKEIVDRAKR